MHSAHSFMQNHTSDVIASDSKADLFFSLFCALLGTCLLLILRYEYLAITKGIYCPFDCPTDTLYLHKTSSKFENQAKLLKTFEVFLKKLRKFIRSAEIGSPQSHQQWHPLFRGNAFAGAQHSNAARQ